MSGTLREAPALRNRPLAREDQRRHLDQPLDRLDEARRVHAGHIRAVCDHRPHVTLKLAVSADGKAGLAGRRIPKHTGYLVTSLFERAQAIAARRANQPRVGLARQGNAP